MSRRGLLLFLSLLFVGVVVFVVGPVIRCAYKHHRFGKNIRVEVELPSCRDEAVEAASSKSCHYIFSFDGETNSDAIQFSGDGLRHNFDARTGAFNVTGTGLLFHKSNVIKIDSTELWFNDQRLPLSTTPVRVLVRQDGRLLSGNCELRW